MTLKWLLDCAISLMYIIKSRLTAEDLVWSLVEHLLVYDYNLSWFHRDQHIVDAHSDKDDPRLSGILLSEDFSRDISPRNGTRTSSSLESECAVARPVISGTYSSAVTGPAQLFITNVSRFGVANSRNGCGSVSWTHRRNKCCRRSILGSSGTTTPVRFKVVMWAFLISVSLLSGKIDERSKVRRNTMHVGTLSTREKYTDGLATF